MWKRLHEDSATYAMDTTNGVIVRYTEYLYETGEIAAVSMVFVPDVRLVPNGPFYKIERRTTR